MYYIGVDGGGTKTAFVLIDNSGAILSSTTRSTCHFGQVGIEGFKEVILGGIEELLNRSNLKLGNITHIFLGIPGYGEVEEANRDIHLVLNNALKNTSFTCGNDVEVSWAGSLACSSGISLVAGTGAIAYGKNESMQYARSSGWGEFCGDEGSGYWIGKKGIEVFAKQSDFRYKRGPLYDTFRASLGLKKEFDLLELIIREYQDDRTKIASLSKLVYNSALLGDSYAIGIFKEAAREHFLMVKGILNQLDFKGSTINISYTGGVFTAGDLVLEPLKELIATLDIPCQLIPPLLTPAKGAALYAMLLSEGEIKNNIIKNLQLGGSNE